MASHESHWFLIDPCLPLPLSPAWMYMCWVLAWHMFHLSSLWMDFDLWLILRLVWRSAWMYVCWLVVGCLWPQTCLPCFETSYLCEYMQNTYLACLQLPVCLYGWAWWPHPMLLFVWNFWCLVPSGMLATMFAHLFRWIGRSEEEISRGRNLLQEGAQNLWVAIPEGESERREGRMCMHAAKPHERAEGAWSNAWWNTLPESPHLSPTQKV